MTQTDRTSRTTIDYLGGVGMIHRPEIRDCRRERGGEEYGTMAINIRFTS